MDKYEHLKIREYGHWSVYLHENQCFLGRVYIWAKRDNFVDLMDTTKAERTELFEIRTALKNALGQLFSPDLFNWAALANEARHCHVHVVPRYKTARVHFGIEFQDANWGKNWAPYDKNFTLTEKALTSLVAEIAAALDQKTQSDGGCCGGNCHCSG